MAFTPSWLRRNRQAGSGGGHRGRTRRQHERRPLWLEQLEERELLSATFGAGPYQTPTNIPDQPLGVLGGCGCPVEPQVTVNPKNPVQLVATQQNGSGVSTDGGATFQPNLQFPVASVAGDTSTVYDSKGRLFWLSLDTGNSNQMTVVQLDPAKGTQIGTNHVVATVPTGNCDDKGFLATDGTNLYVAWDRFSTSSCGGSTTVLLSQSRDQGQNWSPPVTVSGSGEGFVWPATVTVLSDGTIDVAYHSGASGGQVLVANYTFDTNGNATQNFKSTAVKAAAIRGSYPGGPYPLTQGTGESWILGDPTRPGNVYLVAVNDPSSGGAGDPADLIFAHSNDDGKTWTTSTLESGPNNSFQLFPTAAIDKFGDIVVTWYDNRAGATNPTTGFDLLDVYAKYSTDGGKTWSSSFQVNDANNPFDPQSTPPTPPATVPTQTARIADYIGISLFGGTAYVTWDGNTWSKTDANGDPTAGATVTGQQTWLDRFALSGELLVQGDDAGPGTDDTITVQNVPGNPNDVEVLVNGQTQYAGLWSALSDFVVAPGGGHNVVNIADLPANVILNVQSNGSDTVNLGSNGTVQTIQGEFELSGTGTDATLNVDDSKDAGDHSAVALVHNPFPEADYVTGLAPGSITYLRLNPPVVTHLNVTLGTGHDTVTVEATDQPTTITGNGPDTIVVGKDGSLQKILGTLTVTNKAGNLTALTVDDSADTSTQAVTLTDQTLTGLSGPSGAWLTYGGVGNLTLKAGTPSGGPNTFTGSFPGDFNPTLTLSGFTGGQLDVTGDFRGSFLAPTLGTLAAPVGHVSIGGSLLAGSRLKVDYLNALAVGQNLFGTVDGYGAVADPTTQFTIGDVTVKGTLWGDSGSIAAPSIRSINMQPSSTFAGHAAETMPDADFQSLNLGTVTSTGSIVAGAIVSAAISGDMAGQITVSGPLGTLTVGGSLTGSVTAATIGTATITGDLTGSLTATVSLGTLTVGGDITGTVSAPFIANATVNGTSHDDVIAITPTSVVLNGQTVLSATFLSLTVNGRGGNDLFTVTGTVPATLNGGDGDDTFRFADGAAVTGSVSGDGGTNTLDESAYTTPVTVDLRSQTATGIGGTFANITNFIGGSGIDTLLGPNSSSVWVLTGPNTFTVEGLTFSTFKAIVGGSGDDRFVIRTGGSLSGSIDGGGGVNTLDYSTYKGDILVDLALHLATGIGQGVFHVRNVVGSIGNDLLVGDANANVLAGGTGRSVLIGSGGPDTLVGGGGDNILIAGSTVYDQNLTALQAIAAEWDRTDLSFEQRLAHLLSNGKNDNRLNGSYVLSKKTVSTDGASDSVTGGGGLDWVFLDPKTTAFSKRKPGDHITEF